MSDNLFSNKTSDVISEACAWIAQLETGDLTKEDITAFREWMGRSPAHQKEIKRLAYLSNDLNILTEMVIPLKEAATEHRNVTSNRSKISWSNLGYPRIAAFMVILGLSIAFFFSQNDLQPTDPVLITTVVGTHREVKLSDGTIVKLNTDSELEIDFSPERRKVRLLKGEAFFQVTHNPKRPFIVYAGEKSVRAVGTAFVVRHLDNMFEVTVTEGRVQLATTPTSAPEIVPIDLNNHTLQPVITEALPKSIFLDAGESIVYQDTIQEEVVAIPEVEINRKLSWQDGMLDFSETPLSDVIKDLSRYTSLKIEIVDPELADLKFGGLFRIDEIEALFDALESTYNIDVQYQQSGVVLLTRRNQDDIE